MAQEKTSEKPKKTSVTQLVPSTLGLGLLSPDDHVNSPEFISLVSPEETMAGRLQFNSKTSAGSVSSDKIAFSEARLGRDSSSLDIGYRRLPLQASMER